MLLFSALGCAIFGIETVDLDDEYNDVTDPFVVQSWLVGIAPLDAGMDIESSTWSQAALALACFANAAELADMGEYPVTDAKVSFDYGSREVVLDETEAGAYSGSGDAGLAYEPGMDVTLVLNDGELEHRVKMVTPTAPSLDIPTSLPLYEPLTLDITGLGYDGLLAVVVDLLTQEVVFDNTPTDPIAILDFLNGDRPQAVEVPGEVFAQESIYAIGIGGLVAVTDDDFTEFNTELSRVMAGQVRFFGTTTYDVP